MAKIQCICTAVAALAAAPAALAQLGLPPPGNIQLYGQVTAAVTHKTHQTAGDVSNNELSSSQFAASFFGLRGSEDLGGGMAALFRIESLLNTGNGTSSSPVGGQSKFWNRQAFVGLNLSPALTFTAGRQFHAGTDRVIRSLDVYQAGGTSLHVTPLALFGVNRFFGNDNRVDSSVKLRLNGGPMGLQGAVSAGLDDGAGRSVSFDLAQVTDRWSIGVWGTRYRSPNVVAATGDRPEHTAWGVGGNVPLGPVRLYLHYVDSSLDSATLANRPEQTNKIWSLGASWQAAPNVSLKAAYVDDKGKALNTVAGRDGTKRTVVASAEYYLSRRTSLHAGVFSNRFSDGYQLEPVNIAGLARNPTSSSTNGVTAGIRHDF